MKNLSKLLASTALACAAAIAIGSAPAAAQMREHFAVGSHGFHGSVTTGRWHGGGWHRGYWRGGYWHPGWRGNVAIGFYGYPYAYGYPYYGYSDTCDPYNPYYDPYYCSY